MRDKYCVFHIIFNYSVEVGQLEPTKSTMLSKLVIANDFEAKEGELTTINGFSMMVETMRRLPCRDNVFYLLGIAETIFKEDMYNEILEYFIDNNWKCEDALEFYDQN